MYDDDDVCISVGIIYWTDGGAMEVRGAPLIYVLTILAPSLRVVQTC